MLIYGIQKGVADIFIFRSAIGKQTQRTNLWTWREWRRDRVRSMKRVTWKFTIPYVKQITDGNLHMIQGTQTGAL